MKIKVQGTLQRFCLKYVSNKLSKGEKWNVTGWELTWTMITPCIQWWSNRIPPKSWWPIRIHHLHINRKILKLWTGSDGEINEINVFWRRTTKYNSRRWTSDALMWVFRNKIYPRRNNWGTNKKKGTNKIRKAYQWWTVFSKTRTYPQQQQKTLASYEIDVWRRIALKSRAEKIKNTRIRKIIWVAYSIVDDIRTKQLIWFRYVEKMPNDWLRKQIMYHME